jgi:AhpC/TSA family
MKSFVRSVVCLSLVVFGFPSAAIGQSLAEIRFPLTDLQGTIHFPGQNDRNAVRAFVFLSTECPVANGSVKTLNELAKKLRENKQKVELFGVVSDPSVTRQQAATHFAEYRTEFPILFDPSAQLARGLKPTHVPEAFVADRAGRIVYRGAIDNAWEAVGRRRPVAEKTYLADAIASAATGKAVAVPKTTPVGCAFESISDTVPDPRAKVTYTRDIAPIVHARCLNCHRDGQVAPFALATYEQTAKRAKQIAQVTHDRTMPPWIPSGSHAPFVADRRLTDRERQLFQLWADTGKAKGDDADLPPLPKFAEGWQLGTPDVIVRMAKPFNVPADGPDLLQNFVIPIDIPGDKLVAAVEFHPGNKRVAHHAVLFLDDTGTARKLDATTPEPGYANFGGPGFLPSGALGGWSVGNTPRALPDGMGRYLKKGSDLVVQMHYHPTGKPETDRSEVGLYFVKKPVAESLKESAKLVGSIWMANYEMDIPAGTADYRRSTSYVLPKEVLMVGVVPHMHLLGKSMKVTATLPDRTEKTLIDIATWNYNWQDEYYYERPFTLPAGTRLTVDAAFDNSAANPSNPSSPPRRVTYGEGTRDEMLFCFFLMSARKTEDLIAVVFDNLKHDAKQPRKVIDRSKD